MDTTLPTIAGTVSTVVFVGSVLPMLHKALRTRDLSSYSLGNIALANLGNAVHSVYVFNLPPGPIWVLHGFYLVSSALMLYWYVRCRHVRQTYPHGTAAAMTTSSEQLTATSKNAGPRSPARARGSAASESHSTFHSTSKTSTGSIRTGRNTPTRASSDIAVSRLRVTPS
jgi:hypothetical protein